MRRGRRREEERGRRGNGSFMESVCVCETRREIKKLRERMLYLSLTCITHSSSSSSLTSPSLTSPSLTSPSLSLSSSSGLAVQHVLLIIEEY